MKTSILLLSLFISQMALSQDLILHPAGSGGSGCLPGTAEVILGPSSIHLKLTAMSALGSDKPLDRKSCALAVPASLAAGKRLVIEEVVIIGEHKLAKKSTAKISAEAFVAGEKGESLSTTIVGKKGTSQGVVIIGKKLAKSSCDADINIRLNTSIISTSKSPIAGEKASISDVHLKLKLEDCR